MSRETTTRSGRRHNLAFSTAVALIGSVAVASFLVFALLDTNESKFTIAACVVLIIVLALIFYRGLNPDSLRSRFTEDTLTVASDMLEDIRGGLTPQGALAVCERLFPETRASTIAITDQKNVLACVGDMVDDFPPGSPIHTPATHYVIQHGLVQSFTRPVSVASENGGYRKIPAGIVAPLKVSGKTVGALKFYFTSARNVNRTQYALVQGFAELLSTQLTVHELELQEELTARAELRALQAQINPHFLFNTLNTIASFTRTDPLRARELLREFSSFYRATLENSGSLIPISREVAQTKRYLTFEKARFGEDRIKATFEVSDDVADTLVPAFMIQPLVENAVRHGMGDEGALHITVTARKASKDEDTVATAFPNEAGSCVDIIVADDGVGMDKETAERLFDEHIPQPDFSAPQGGGAGVATHNIAARVKRFYGPRSYIRVDSRPGGGTQIILHLDVVETNSKDG